jgi:hypothetical protein
MEWTAKQEAGLAWERGWADSDDQYEDVKRESIDEPLENRRYNVRCIQHAPLHNFLQLII